MKIDEIHAMESENADAIHLVRDRLFWQAWERSAFRFVRLFRPYKVHSRFVQKIGAAQVWLGFPKTNLELFEREAAESGLLWNALDGDHVVVTGFAPIDGFEEWKRQVCDSAGTAASERSACPETSPEPSEKRRLRLYRIAYDLALYVAQRTVKVAKGFKYGIADKLRDDCLELLECLHLSVNGIGRAETARLLEKLFSIRLKLRLLHDLRQISSRQWLFANGRIEEMLSLIGRSPPVPRNGGAGLNQSDGPLAPLTQVE